MTRHCSISTMFWLRPRLNKQFYTLSPYMVILRGMPISNITHASCMSVLIRNLLFVNEPNRRALNNEHASAQDVTVGQVNLTSATRQSSRNHLYSVVMATPDIQIRANASEWIRLVSEKNRCQHETSAGQLHRHRSDSLFHAPPPMPNQWRNNRFVACLLERSLDM